MVGLFIRLWRMLFPYRPALPPVELNRNGPTCEAHRIKNCLACLRTATATEAAKITFREDS